MDPPVSEERVGPESERTVGGHHLPRADRPRRDWRRSRRRASCCHPPVPGLRVERTGGGHRAVAWVEARQLLKEGPLRQFAPSMSVRGRVRGLQVEAQAWVALQGLGELRRNHPSSRTRQTEPASPQGWEAPQRRGPGPALPESRRTCPWRVELPGLRLAGSWRGGWAAPGLAGLAVASPAAGQEQMQVQALEPGEFVPERAAARTERLRLRQDSYETHPG